MLKKISKIVNDQLERLKKSAGSNTRTDSTLLISHGATSWVFKQRLSTKIEDKDSSEACFGQKVTRNNTRQARLSVDQMMAIGRARWEGKTPLRAGLARLKSD